MMIERRWPVLLFTPSSIYPLLAVSNVVSIEQYDFNVRSTNRIALNVYVTVLFQCMLCGKNFYVDRMVGICLSSCNSSRQE